MPRPMSDVHENGGHRDWPKSRCPLCREEHGGPEGLAAAIEARMRLAFPTRDSEKEVSE